MKRTRELRGWWFLSFIILMAIGASFSYAQTNTFPPDGNVGIGTLNPERALHVKSSSSIGELVLENTSQSGSAMTFKKSGVQYSAIGMTGAIEGNTTTDLGLVADTVSGNIRFYTGGSGTEKLRITSEGAVQSRGFFQLHDGTANLGAMAPYRLVAGAGTDNSLTLFSESSLYITTGGSAIGRVVISPSGNVGIGTGSPAALLHVAGNAQVDGNIAAKYQDVAEWVKTSNMLPPGTVVSIDPQRSNQVLPSNRAYDTGVAGVVSLQPGIILGEAGEDKVKVAHSGRVKVKADAQYGPIAVGDLLVSSSTSGYAMRSTPVDVSGISMHRPGTIIGKALEPLKDGQGEILVLLTLQ